MDIQVWVAIISSLATVSAAVITVFGPEFIRKQRKSKTQRNSQQKIAEGKQSELKER